MKELFGFWNWYIAGPLIGLMVPLLYIVTNKALGVSSNFQHLCAAILPNSKIEYFKYNWKEYTWSLVFAAGILAGGFVATFLLSTSPPQLLPAIYFDWPGVLRLFIGGILVGFGARYAGGCTSGHGITGLAGLHFSSLVAVISFLLGGIFFTNIF